MKTDVEVARLIADEASCLLLEVRAAGFASEMPQVDLKNRGDALSHELIMRRFGEFRPDDAVLSEEGADDLARLDAARVWIVDPLDGTREFSERGRDDWAVHIALWVSGELQFGVVCLPERGVILDDTARRATTANADRPRILVSRTRPPAEAQLIAEALGGELVGMGSAGAKTATILRGEAELYVHSGGQYEWDLAAPVGVARAAGLHATRIDGSPFVFNTPNPYLPDALIGDPQLAALALKALGIEDRG